MPPIYSFNANTTSIYFDWPNGITGLERVALASQGDLQRILSAFFNKPIHVIPIYSNTHIESSSGSNSESHIIDIPQILPDPTILSSTSPTSPIIQHRQVHLECQHKTVCIATSKVRITSPKAARLFLVEKFAIGQMFKKLELQPTFELLHVGFGKVDSKRIDGWIDINASADGHGKEHSPEYGYGGNEDEQLWRIYRLSIPEFDCVILEVFPTRDMFRNGEEWLLDIKEPYPDSESGRAIRHVGHLSSKESGGQWHRQTTSGLRMRRRIGYRRCGALTLFVLGIVAFFTIQILLLFIFFGPER